MADALDVATDGIFSVETVATITEHGSSSTCLFWKGSTLTGNSNWRLWVRRVDDPPNYTIEGTTSPIIELGSTHHYCMTGDGTTIRYYVDGTLVHSAPFFAPTGEGSADRPVRVGDPAYPDSGCWRGFQRNCAAFDKCLTPDQVARHALYSLYVVGGSLPSQYTAIPDAPGWYVDKQGKIAGTGSVQTITTQGVPLRDIVADLFQRAGLTPDDYDVSQL